MNLRKNIIPLLFLAPLTLGFTNTDSKNISQNMGIIKEKKISPEAYYLDAMTSHQTESLKMAQLAVKRAKNPELKILAQKMAREESKELELLSKWSTQYSSTMQSQEEAPLMEDLTQLEKVDEDQFDKKFTTLMAQHHKNGIKISKNIGPLIENKKIKDFSEKSVSKQSMEIGYLDELSQRF